MSLQVLAAQPQGITVSNQWMRFIVPSTPAAGYLTLNNATDKPYVLDGVASSACGELMMHRSVREGGVERMTMEMSVEIPAHGSLDFAPGGYHLMCVAPRDALRPGKTVDVTLHFSDGSELSVDFPVRSMKDE
ncbi:MAG TPA: copper chaperone PCu(A)C [Spongiibacteraceae bacterium]|nr:copper chaperone PCu(A)C [Spongiibacteraceae bacterium]